MSCSPSPSTTGPAQAKQLGGILVRQSSKKAFNECLAVPFEISGKMCSVPLLGDSLMSRAPLPNSTKLVWAK